MLEKLKSRLKHTVKSNKYHSKTKILNAPNPHLGYLTDPSFQGVNRLFILSFNFNDNRNGHSWYYLLNTKVKS